MTGLGVVGFGLIRQVGGDPAGTQDRYTLARNENNQAEIIISGLGLPTRQQIAQFLRDITDLGGPDAAAALAAMRQGWVVVRSPVAPSAETGT